MLNFRGIFNMVVFVLSLQTNMFAQHTAEYFISIVETTTDKQEKYNALDSLIFPLKWRPATNQFVDFTKAYVDLAIEKENYDDAIEATLRAFTVINTQLGQADNALALLEKVEQYKDKTNDSYLLGGIYLKKGGGYFNGKSFQKAIDNYTLAIENYSDNDSIYKADAFFFRGQANFSKGNFLNAINDYNLSSRYYEKLGDIDYMLYARAEVISCYSANGFNDKTIEERDKLIALRLKTNRLNGIVTDFYNQSMVYKKLNQIEKQKAYLKKAEAYLDKDKEQNDLKVITVNTGLASFYIDQNQIKTAKTYLDIAENATQSFDSITYASVYVTKAKIKYLIATEKYKEAEKLASTTLLNAKTWGKTSYITELNGLLYQIHSKTGNYKSALQYFEQKTTLEDSIFSTEKANAFSYYQTLYETEVKEKEILKKNSAIEILEMDKEIQKSQKHILVFLLLSCLLAAAGIISTIRQRSKKLKEKIAHHKRELDIFTTELLHKSQEHELLSSELKVLKESQKTENKLDKLQDLTSSKILTVQDWEEFKVKFENVYPKFFVKARMTNNDITNAEERLLALEKLNLKTPEIANILGVSADSVVKNRYRLRKKLGISRETSITDFVEA